MINKMIVFDVLNRASKTQKLDSKDGN